jgi:hypothetical protein
MTKKILIAVAVLAALGLAFVASRPAVFRFELAPSGSGTRVTWSMEGRNGLLGKAISLVLDMDEMVGKDFERGLAALGAAARAEALAAAR